MEVRNRETGEIFEAWEFVVSNEYGRSMALVKGVSPKELQNLVKAGYRSTGTGMQLQFEVVHGDNVTVGQSGDYLQRNNEGILGIISQAEFEKTYEVVE